MNHNRSSLKPIQGANRSLRRRLTLKGEFALALAPTVIVLAVLALVEVLSRQRLLFASLASSAFLIYLDPEHGTNSVRTLLTSQLMAATIGFFTHLVFGSGYLSGGCAMVITIVLMILLDAVHPPAVSTSLNFALSTSA
jgi:CBS-domain-containing membrane protein